ncbi:MAG: mechanosensitive ion channel family protein [Nitrospirales bacterium]|nr:mechanosensitive ion channel family protein [Nitrospirales bacterium]
MMKCQPGQASRKMVICAVALLLTIAWEAGSTTATQYTDFPLQPPDTSSPRATMDSFLSNMREGQNYYLKYLKRYEEEPGLYPSETALADFNRAAIFIGRAGRCLNLSKIPPTLVDRVGLEGTVLLKTIFDRINLPSTESIPNASEMKEKGLIRWRVPNTEITIAQVPEGPREGEYLFSPSTVDRLDDDYLRIKHLPHKPGGWVGIYTLYSEVSGRVIPDKFVRGMPDWAKTRVLNHPLWKWILSVLVLALFLLALMYIRRISRGRPDEAPFRRAFRRILFPVSIIATAYLLNNLQLEIGFIGDISEGMSRILLAVTYLGGGWTVVLIGNLIAEGVIAGPRVTSKGMDAAMIRVVARIISFGIAAWVIIIGAQTIGIPLVPVLAGLGVGGLALALSAQPTVENFIGGMMLFTDRPVRLGELVKFGDQFGRVEEIGVRSTRIRTLDRTLVTVPNAEFSKLQLENYSKRDKMWFNPRIRLPLDTTPDQLRYILVEIRKMLYAHPKVLQDPARVRLVEFGEYSLDLEIFAYIDVKGYEEYLGIIEDLNFRIMEVLSQAGSGLAMPVERMVPQERKGLDKKRRREVEAEVEAWRKNHALYLPKFPEEKIEELEGTLPYPPPGSPKKANKE